MIANVKKYLLHLLCAVALLGGMTACDGFNINWGGSGSGSGDENVHELVNCWHLVTLYGTAVDADIYIDFGKDGKFAIYQRTESLEFTVFNGTYTIDEENSIVSGVYDDGTLWLCDYSYVVESNTLTLTNVDNSSDVAVYEKSKVPASAAADTKCASVNDVKPL